MCFKVPENLRQCFDLEISDNNIDSKDPVKHTEHFTAQHRTFVECKIFRVFDHLVECCSPLLSLVQ